MIVINTVNSERFSLNGIEYFKNFTPVVAGDSISILNTYANCFTLVNSTNYSQFTVDGVTYASVALLQSALLPVIYSRGTLGVSINTSIAANISGTYEIDWSAAGNWDLKLTSNTTLTQTNNPLLGFEKTITVYVLGDFALTLPTEWVVVGGGTYDGVNGSQIVVQSWDDGNYHTVINDIT